jgi:hypothetical protein
VNSVGVNHFSFHVTTYSPVACMLSWGMKDINGGQDGRRLGTALGHFLLHSHNFMVTALGSCVRWPLGYVNVIFFKKIKQAR